MIIKVKEKTLVKPSKRTPRKSLWLSELDLLYNVGRATCLYLYKNNNSSNNFFDLNVLKEALANILVPYYPIAGRLMRRHEDGRLEIMCNEEGVLLVVAETSAVMDELGADFCTFPELTKLTPPPSDYSAGISSFPLLVIQITYFQCGGVSLSVGVEHIAIDGNSLFDFVNAWSEIARGQLNPTIMPYLDRTLLLPRHPPQIKFNHMDPYQIPTNTTNQSMKKTTHNNSAFKLTLVKITKQQLNILKSKTTINYSTFAILAGLIWKCRTSMARELSNYEESKLFISINGRPRLKPSLPPEYFGNVVFHTTTVATLGDLRMKPLWYAVNQIHETLKRFDDNEYLRSAIDFLTVHPNTKHVGLEECRCPNLGIYSWANFSTLNADFGWGGPFYMGNSGIINHEGRVFIFDGDDNLLNVLISLVPEHVEGFRKLFYEFVESNSHHVISDATKPPLQELIASPTALSLTARSPH